MDTTGVSSGPGETGPTLVLIELKRLQTFLFTVPRLKEMLGANALIGETIRSDLVKLAEGCGAGLPADLAKVLPAAPARDLQDPLAGTNVSEAIDPHLDDPRRLLEGGILSREGGHFTALFPDGGKALAFVSAARGLLESALPGLPFDIEARLLAKADDRKARSSADPPPAVLPELPIFQVCTASGRDVAERPGAGPDEYISHRVRSLQTARNRFRRGKTPDLVGLMTAQKAIGQHGETPGDLRELVGNEYLAVIHADGNGLGRRFNQWRSEGAAGSGSLAALQREVRNERFFHGMRVAVRRALTDAVAETFGGWAGQYSPYQVLMLGGDDLLLICRARYALPFLIAYAQRLADPKLKLPDCRPLSIGAGVVIARHTFPFHRLHALAEALAGSAKRLHRARQDGAERPEISVADWMVVTNAWALGRRSRRRAAQESPGPLPLGRRDRNPGPDRPALSDPVHRAHAAGLAGSPLDRRGNPAKRHRGYRRRRGRPRRPLATAALAGAGATGPPLGGGSLRRPGRRDPESPGGLFREKRGRRLGGPG